MCGIVGYVGKSEDVPKVLLEGLKRLEYRGYDSAGLAIADPKKVFLRKVRRQGDHSAISDLEKKIGRRFSPAASGIAHTRWATHGEPTEANAHPHTDCKRRIFLVHNGIIENYLPLKKYLQEKGHKFVSDTDTEVLAHLIEDSYDGDLESAVRQALAQVQGTFGIAVLHQDHPDLLVVAKQGSPLGIGVGDGEYIVASDAAPIIAHTKQVIYLDDGEIGVLTKNNHKISSLQTSGEIDRPAEEIEWDSEEAEKGGFDHFMLKEISEQPESVYNSIRGRIDYQDGVSVLGGIRDQAERLRDIRNITIVACGTAYYAGLVGEYMLEGYGGVRTEVEYASEFRYRSPVLDSRHSAILAISQSGETADTLAAIREAKRRGVLALGVVNSVGSTIARETDAGVYNHAGPEIGVASTKAFTSQLAVLSLLSIFLGRQRQLSAATGQRLVSALADIPEQIESILEHGERIKEIAERYKNSRDFLFLGRKYNFPIALEGALKLKEISYIHAEGYSAGEMKHGPLALIDESFPSVCIVTKNSIRDKMISNIKELQARRGRVIAIATAGDKEVAELVDDVIYIPSTEEMLEPLLTAIPLQLFAYYTAVALGRDVDKPRNLAKSVTVE
jgi:glutamine---fructose-6-phosphate transaminase (isomerizing)